MLSPLDTTGYSKQTKWCVPSAVAIIAGIPLREATQMLARIHNQTYAELEVAWAEDAILALHALGFKATPVPIMTMFPDTTHGPTLKRFMAERTPDMFMNMMFIEVSGHVLTSHMGFAADNWTENVVSFNQFPKPHRLVKRAWIVNKMR